MQEPFLADSSGNLATWQPGNHQIHLFAMNSATITTFTTAIGRNTFQPSFIRRSYFRRGIVQRTQTKTKRMAVTFTVNASADSAKPSALGGSLYQGMSQPPRKSVVISADIVAIAMYSDMKKSANFIDEYSV